MLPTFRSPASPSLLFLLVSRSFAWAVSATGMYLTCTSSLQRLHYWKRKGALPWAQPTASPRTDIFVIIYTEPSADVFMSLTLSPLFTYLPTVSGK